MRGQAAEKGHGQIDMAETKRNKPAASSERILRALSATIDIRVVTGKRHVKQERQQLDKDGQRQSSSGQRPTRSTSGSRHRPEQGKQHLPWEKRRLAHC
jgi:hypothetical protein